MAPFTTLRFVSMITAVLAIATAGALCPALAQDKVTVRAAYVPTANLLPSWVAKDKGIFARNGLEVSLTPIQNLSLLPPTLGRQFEIVPTTPPDFLKAVASGLDVVAVAGLVIETSRNMTTQVVVRKDSGITHIRQLPGKTIATPTAASVIHVSFQHSLKSLGLDPNSVRAVEVPFPNMADQLKSGRVDAVEAVQPFLGQMLGQGFVGLGSPALSVSDPALLVFWIAQGAWARQNPAAVGKWTASLVEAQSFMEKSGAEARAVLAKYTNLPEPIAQKLPLPTYQFSLDNRQFDAWIKVLRDLGQLSVPLDTKKLIVTGK